MTNETKTAAQIKAERIAQARADLAARQAADPAGVARFNARMARLAAAKKREQERIDLLVMGADRPPSIKTKTKVRGKRRTIATPAPLDPAIDRALSLREAWSHKKGTPETQQRAANTHQGSLAQLFANATIDAEQLEWAAEISNVHRSIESDVAVAVASLEARVDQSRSSLHLASEGVRRVRLHAAYTRWRELLPAPKQMVLDMIVGDAIGYSVAARRYRVSWRQAKRELVAAIDRWPDCKALAARQISQDDVVALDRRLA